jgi:hypothetical protein
MPAGVKPTARADDPGPSPVSSQEQPARACDDESVTSASTSGLGGPEVSRDELIRALRAKRITLVDVLSPDSFAAMRIPGAVNLPVVDLARRAPDVLPDRRARIVTYCGGPT